ncbi:glucan biosynthesis protein [Halomonas sp. BBD48]|nr:glucan biosynthesis protein [Halomonas sp. BBD48]
MKVWQCIVVSGLACVLTLAQAQETSTSPQNGEPPAENQPEQPSQGAAEPKEQPAQPETGDEQEADQETTQQASSDSAPKQDWTPDAVFEHVIERARDMAGAAYTAPESALPEELANMEYHDFRNIRFRRDAALWRGERLFEVQFFHPGFLYDTPVDIHVLRDGRIDEIAFDSEIFEYEGQTGHIRDVVKGMDPGQLGFAGFRLHFPLNTPQYKDEFLVFLGASYFRMIGRDQTYGISARGLAVDTATQGGEEFPAFQEFWLVPPEPNSSHITVFALLDSPSVAGAYRFDIEAANNTVINVDSRLFARNDVAKLGVAPLTSMFLYGENSVQHYDDFRPEVHDSDGMLMHTSGNQWIWRPLSNPPSLNVSQLRDNNPLGFGLMQRDRDFEHYLDTALNYEERPSLWVETQGGDWGEGGVELVEIPADSETYDNIVAYWVPDKEFRAGDERRYQYRLTTYDEPIPHREFARVVRTRQGWGAQPGESNGPPRSLRRFVVDFAGGELSSLSASQPVEAKLTTSTGETSELHVRKLPDGKTWRAMFKLAPQDDDPADMQLQLMLRGKPLTETWSYIWDPNDL